MTDKELKKLSRVELLEMLVEMSKENETLQNKIIEQNERHEAEIEKINADFQLKIDYDTGEIERRGRKRKEA